LTVNVFKVYLAHVRAMNRVNLDVSKKRKRERGKRFELIIDDYTDACIDKIKDFGFNSRKDAVRFAIQRVAGMIDRGEIKRVK
jgi:hypothetical protein